MNGCKDRTVPELKATCKERGIRGYSRLNRQQLVDACCGEARDAAPVEERRPYSPVLTDDEKNRMTSAFKSECDAWNGAAGMKKLTGDGDAWTLKLSCKQVVTWEIPAHLMHSPYYIPQSKRLRKTKWNRPADHAARIEQIARDHDVAVTLKNKNGEETVTAWIRSRVPGQFPMNETVAINDGLVNALEKLGSTCEGEFAGTTFQLECDHDKNDGVIFEARTYRDIDTGEYDRELEGYDPDEDDLDDTIEDDDFPNFVGRDIVKKTAREAVEGAGRVVKSVAARDHEKGLYDVLVKIERPR